MKTYRMQMENKEYNTNGKYRMQMENTTGKLYNTN
jgi:hypothetical protein